METHHNNKQNNNKIIPACPPASRAVVMSAADALSSACFWDSRNHIIQRKILAIAKATNDYTRSDEQQSQASKGSESAGQRASEQASQRASELASRQAGKQACSFGLFKYDSFVSFRAIGVIWGIES